FDGVDLEESAKDGVERQEGRGHPRTRGHELPPTDSEATRGTPGRVVDERRDAPLLECLVERNVFLVGDHPRGNRRKSVGLDVLPPLRRPAARAHGPGSACRALARSMSRNPGTLTVSGANRPPTATPPGSGP